MKQITKDFINLDNALNSGKRFIVAKYSLRVAEVKEVIEIYNEQLVTEYGHISDGRNIHIIGTDNKEHWCNVEGLYTHAQAEEVAKKLKEKEQHKKIKENNQKILELKRRIKELEQEINNV